MIPSSGTFPPPYDGPDEPPVRGYDMFVAKLPAQ